MPHPTVGNPIEFQSVFIHIDGDKFRFSQSAKKMLSRERDFPNKTANPLKLEICDYSPWLICNFADGSKSVVLLPDHAISLKVSLNHAASGTYTPDIINGYVLIQKGDDQERIPITFEPANENSRIKWLRRTGIVASLIIMVGLLGTIRLPAFKQGGNLKIERSLVQTPLVPNGKELQMVDAKIPFKILDNLKKDKMDVAMQGILGASADISAEDAGKEKKAQSVSTEKCITNFVKRVRGDWDHWPDERNLHKGLDAYFYDCTGMNKLAVNDARVYAIMGFLAAARADKGPKESQNEYYKQAAAYWELASGGDAEKWRMPKNQPAVHHEKIKPKLHQWLAAIYLARRGSQNYSKAASEMKQYKDDPKNETLSPELLACLASLEYMQGDTRRFRELLQQSDASKLNDLGLPNLFTAEKTRFKLDTPHVTVSFDNKQVQGKYHEIHIKESDWVGALDINCKAFGMVMSFSDQNLANASSPSFALFEAPLPTSDSGSESPEWSDYELHNGIYVMGVLSPPKVQKGDLIHGEFQTAYVASLADDACLYQQGELTLRWQTSRARAIDIDLVLPEDLYPIEYEKTEGIPSGTLISRSKTKSEVEFAVTPTLFAAPADAVAPQYWAEVKLYCEKSNALLGRLALLVLGDLIFTIATFAVLFIMTRVGHKDELHKLFQVLLPLFIAGLAGEFFWKCNQRSAADVFPGAACLLIFTFLLFLAHIALPQLAAVQYLDTSIWQRRRSALCLFLCLVHAFVASHLMHHCVLGQSAFLPLSVAVFLMLGVMMSSIWTLRQSMGGKRFTLFGLAVMVCFVWLVGKTWDEIPALSPVPFLGNYGSPFYVLGFIGVPLVCFALVSVLPMTWLTILANKAKPYLQPYDHVVTLTQQHKYDPIFWLTVIGASFAVMQSYTQVVSIPIKPF